MIGRRITVAVTLACYVATHTCAVAGAHEEGIAAGQAAIPVARGSVSAPSATSVVPGYTAAPPERLYYGQPNLAAQGGARLASCASRPNDPVCQAQRGAVDSADTPRPAVGATDPAVAAVRAISQSPSRVLGDLSAYYSGCRTAVTRVPASVQPRSCLRYAAAGVFSCTRSLDVSVERNPNCTPGNWFAHAASGSAGIDVQCLPDRSAARQHLRATDNGTPVAYFDVDMTSLVVFPEMVAVIGTSHGFLSWRGNRTGVWVTDKYCSGATCNLTATIAPEPLVVCSANSDVGLDCKTIGPFLKTYAACAPGTQSGDNIQNTICQGETGCTTSVLDDAKCYSPAQGWGPYEGTDVTGRFAGHYWNSAADRPVVGWSVNPGFGPIATMRLTYTRPAMTANVTDHWDDQCPAARAGGRCTVRTAARCTDGPATRTIDGVEVTRDCWQYTSTLSCAAAAAPDECVALVAAGCTPQSSACKQTDPTTGACEVFEDGYQCSVPAHDVTTASNCPANVFCLAGNCFDIASVNDPDFARSMSLLEAGREAGVYLDTDRMQVFKGEENRCRDRLFKDCCYADGAGAGMTNQSLFGVGSRLVYDVLMNAENRAFLYEGVKALLTGAGFGGSFTTYGVTVAVNGTALPAGSSLLYSGDSIVIGFDPWSLAIAVVIYVVMSMMSCNADEGQLAMKEGAKLCHTIGQWCSSCLRVLGFCVSCIEHTTSKCCFNSTLARIINEQGRRQIGKGWGGAENADCSGFTVAQLQRLDFAAMDLSEFYASIVPTLPNFSTLQGSNASRVRTCYFGQGRCQ